MGFVESLSQKVQRAWLCIGDFNEILWSLEKRGGNPKSLISMGLSREALDKCELTYLGYNENPYTWSNGLVIHSSIHTAK